MIATSKARGLTGEPRAVRLDSQVSVSGPEAEAEIPASSEEAPEGSPPAVAPGAGEVTGG